MITGMDVAYHFFITPVMKVSVLQLWTTRGMDSCLVIALNAGSPEAFYPLRAETGRKSQEIAVKSI